MRDQEITSELDEWILIILILYNLYDLFNILI